MMNRRTLLSLSASAPLLASGCAAPSSLATPAPALHCRARATWAWS